jgi:AcrR family transcriptional regulator
MGSAEPARPRRRGPSSVSRSGAPRTVGHGAAQTRVIEAALVLFAEHGVGGTSLQMIADAIGVTKAAVYQQFQTKEEIVLATAEVVLARLDEAVEAAEAEKSPSRARELLIAGLIDLAVERRRVASILQRDPVMIRVLEEHEPFRQGRERLYRLLVGDRAGAEARVQAAMLSAAIGGAVIHPLAANLDDETLRSQLLRLARRFARLPE